MNISTSVARFVDFYRRNGLRATVRRVQLALRRTLFSGSSVLFYCDLPTLTSPAPELPGSLKVERHRTQADLSPQDFGQITSFWNPKLASRNIRERFGLGASLWLIRYEDKLAGYGWTLQGRTVEPHYFPLGPDDVQFLDFHVFPKYRGRGMDWFLMTHILHQLAGEGRARAFGEAAEWNKASLSSFGMTPFRRLGFGKKFTLGGYAIVYWSGQMKSEENHLLEKSPVVAHRPTVTKTLSMRGRE